MPSITDWLMVIVTIIYVVATIKICSANIQSARATREQLEESKRQFQETKRLEMMPYFQINVMQGDVNQNSRYGLALSNTNSANLKVSSVSKKIQIENIGLGAAKEVTYTWKNQDKCFSRHDLHFSAIRAGQSQEMSVDFCMAAVQNSQPYEIETSMTFIFCDLLENQYKQVLTLVFNISSSCVITLKKAYTTSPERISKENAYV